MKYEPRQISQKSIFQYEALDHLYNLKAPVVYECKPISVKYRIFPS